MKSCIDCNCSFNAHDSQQVRCKKCQEAYRKLYKSSWWNDKPSSARKYYQFYKFALTMTDTELLALISIKRTKMNEKGCDYQTIRSHIKILTTIYASRKEERKEDNLEEDEKEKERYEILNKGVDYETYG